MRKTALTKAIVEWKRAIGASRVIVDLSTREAAASTTYELRNRVAAIVRPRTREEVQECMRIATRNHVAIYPVSGGKNFGYGSAAPTQDQSVIFDLSSMKRLELDRELGAVTLEPGVTNAALASHLSKHAPELVASLPGGTSPDASPMGNALDGGVGSGVYNDRFSHVYSLEVVLGTGEIIHTGLDRYEGGARLGHTEARVGPTPRELFLQSGFGVVTRMTFGLFPMPGDLRVLIVRIERDRLADFLDRMRPLARANVLTSMLSFFNETLAAMTELDRRYPWTVTQGRAPLPTEIFSQLRGALGRRFTEWAANIDLLSIDRAFGDAREHAIRRALRGFKVWTVPISDADRRRYWIPDGNTLPLAYWRKVDEPASDVQKLDPHRDKCGLVWCDFVLPSSGELFAKITPYLESLVRSYGFDPAIKAHTFWPRAIYFAVILIYDRTIPGEDLRAERCDRAITAYLARLGVLPGRRRVGSMDLLPPFTDDSEAVLARIRRTLDPSEVIAPGRYDAAVARRQNERASSSAVVDETFDAVEKLHLELVDTWIPSKKKLPAGPTRPLRPHMLGRAAYDSAHRAARALLPALVAGARELLARPAWRKLLDLDDELARALQHRIHRQPSLGKLEGAFDAHGVYKIFGFSASVGGVQETLDLARRLSLPGWRSTLSSSELRAALQRAAGNSIGVIRSPRSKDLLDFVKQHARTCVPLSSSRLTPSSRARLDALFAVGWRDLLRANIAPALRSVILDQRIVHNAVADLVFANLALLALLTDPAERPSLAKSAALAVDRHLPWTRVLRDGHTTFRGKRIHLPSFVRDNPHLFVLRPILQGDESNLFGAFLDPHEWKDALSNSLHSSPSHVVQERVASQLQVFPFANDRSLVFDGAFVATQLLLLDARLAHGCLTHIGFSPNVGPRCPSSFLLPALVRTHDRSS